MGLESLRTLVVDDEPGNRDIVACNLMGLGYQVETCGSGEEAIDRMDGADNTNGQIDLLLTDLEMFEKNGLDVARRFREKYPKSPMILMTASDVKVPEGLFKARLRKPFDSEQLINTILRCSTENTLLRIIR